MLSFIPSTGAASARMTTADAAAASTGRRWTTAAHRSASGTRRAPSAGRASTRVDPERLRELSPRRNTRASLDGFASRVPVNPSSAGSRVSEPARTHPTVAAAAIATPFISGCRSTSRPSVAMITVAPAKRTARPAVDIAVTTAPSTVAPVRMASLKRVTMNSA